MNTLWIIAQTEGGEAAPESIGSTAIGENPEVESVTGQDGSPEDPNDEGGFFGPGSPLSSPLVFFGLMIVMFYFILLRGPRKKQQQHKQMVQSLERNDRIRTIGGIIGTVVDVKDDEITLKIDESNNTKMKIVASAVGKNLTKEK
jgi:preprotein translocase subunit YajC